MYLDKNMIVATIEKVNDFKNELALVFDKFGLDIDDNTGRRNQLLSVMQETALAEQLSLRFDEVEVDDVLWSTIKHLSSN